MATVGCGVRDCVELGTKLRSKKKLENTSTMTKIAVAGLGPKRVLATCLFFQYTSTIIGEACMGLDATETVSQSHSGHARQQGRW